MNTTEQICRFVESIISVNAKIRFGAVNSSNPLSFGLEWNSMGTTPNRHEFAGHEPRLAEARKGNPEHPPTLTAYFLYSQTISPSLLHSATTPPLPQEQS